MNVNEEQNFRNKFRGTFEQISLCCVHTAYKTFAYFFFKGKVYLTTLSYIINNQIWIQISINTLIQFTIKKQVQIFFDKLIPLTFSTLT